jgi:hypothetical protein
MHRAKWDSNSGTKADSRREGQEPGYAVHMVHLGRWLPSHVLAQND